MYIFTITVCNAVFTYMFISWFSLSVFYCFLKCIFAFSFFLVTYYNPFGFTSVNNSFYSPELVWMCKKNNLFHILILIYILNTSLNPRKNVTNRIKQGRPYLLCFLVSTHWPLPDHWIPYCRQIGIHLPLVVSTNQPALINDSYLIGRRSFQPVVITRVMWTKLQMKNDDLAKTSVLSIIYKMNYNPPGYRKIQKNWTLLTEIFYQNLD